MNERLDVLRAGELYPCFARHAPCACDNRHTWLTMTQSPARSPPARHGFAISGGGIPLPSTNGCCVAEGRCAVFFDLFVSSTWHGGDDVS